MIHSEESEKRERPEMGPRNVSWFVLLPFHFHPSLLNIMTFPASFIPIVLLRSSLNNRLLPSRLHYPSFPSRSYHSLHPGPEIKSNQVTQYKKIQTFWASLLRLFVLKQQQSQNSFSSQIALNPVIAER